MMMIMIIIFIDYYHFIIKGSEEARRHQKQKNNHMFEHDFICSHVAAVECVRSDSTVLHMYLYTFWPFGRLTIYICFAHTMNINWIRIGAKGKKYDQKEWK